MIENFIYKKWILNILGIFVILFLGIELCYDLDKYADIDLSDEMYYLISGKSNVYIASRVLYPLWYKFLHIFTSDSIQLFYLNQKILIILLPICIFLFLFKITLNFILSLLFSCCFLYSNTNVATEYIYHGKLVTVLLFKINNFTLCLLCIFSIIIHKLSKKGWSTISLLTISFFILSYCRNEYGVLFILCALLYIYLYFKKLKHVKHEKMLFIYFWIFAAITFYFFGLSIVIKDFSNLHFVYSYSWNFLDRNHLPINMTSDLVSPCINAFGNQSGLVGFFISNPIEFMKNVLFNFYTLFIINSFRITDILLPQVFFEYKDMSVFNYLVALLIAIMIFVFLYRFFYHTSNDILKKSIADYKKNNLKKTISVVFIFLNKNPLFTFNFLVISIVLFSNIIFMYDPRYFIHFAPFIFLIVIILLNKLCFKRIIQYFGMLAILILILGKPSAKEYFQQYKIPVEKNILYTISVLNNYKAQTNKQQINILNNNGDFGQVVEGAKTYNYSILSMKTDDDSIKRFNNLSNFDVIIINEYKEKENYLWRNKIKNYVNSNLDLFYLKKKKYLNYTNYIYLRK